MAPRDERVLAELALDGDPAVESIKPILAPYKLVSRELQAHDTLVDIGGVTIGGDRLAVIAGPCAVESAIAAHPTNAHAIAFVNPRIALSFRR